MNTTAKETEMGFTLVELLVVVSIISLLSSVVLASVSEARERAQDATRIQIVREYKKAFQYVYQDLGHYPIPGAFAVGAYCIGDFSDGQCGPNDALSQSGPVNNAIAPYFNGTIPKPDPVTVYGGGWFEMEMEGVKYQCYDTNCDRAQLTWGMSQDDYCPGGEVYTGVDGWCVYDLE